eukprot:15431670-Alexandrium_andersonii.AAC.1
MNAYFTYERLLAFQWKGDTMLEEFYNEWLHMVANLQEKVDIAMLKQILLGRLRKSTILQFDLAFFDRQDWTEKPQEAYDTLLGYIDGAISRTRLAANQDAVLHRTGPAAPAQERGRGRGKGKGGNRNASKPKAEAKAGGKKGKGRGTGGDGGGGGR